MDPDRRTQYLCDPVATHALGERLGSTARAGDIILLSGDLGAGKTSLTQGIARGLGIEARVTSPTFTLLNEYHEGRVPLYHFDLYRLEEADILAQGFLDYWEAGDGLAVLEWAERLGASTPGDRLEVRLTMQGEGRLVELLAHGDRPKTWLNSVTSDVRA